MALTYKWHRQTFGPTDIAISSTNVVIAEIDLNGADLLNGSSGDCDFSASIHALCYTTSGGLYPFNFYYEASMQKRSSTYTSHTFTAMTSLGAVVLTLNAAIASTSLYRVRATNVDGSIAFKSKVFMDVRMYNV